MFDEQKYREACASLHASEDMIKEIFAMAEARNNKKNALTRRGFILAATVVLALALGITASAHLGLWDWIIDAHRDADTRQRGAIAREAAEQASGQELELDDTALELDKGILYSFDGKERENADPAAQVQVDETGRITWLDLRQLYPYPQPDDCPEEYTIPLTGVDGVETEHFLADRYLAEVVYPDRDAYNEKVQSAAREALDAWRQEGYIEACAEDVDLIYFANFNAGSAMVDVLMKNGDVYVLFLQPDDFTPTGFLLHTAEAQSTYEHNDFPALFDAVRSDTLDDYYAARQADFAEGVG